MIEKIHHSESLNPSISVLSSLWHMAVLSDHHQPCGETAQPIMRFQQTDKHKGRELWTMLSRAVKRLSNGLHRATICWCPLQQSLNSLDWTLDRWSQQEAVNFTYLLRWRQRWTIYRRFMYTIERLNDTSSEREVWVQEIQYRTEFKAFVSARTKCMATGKTYRIFDTESKNVQCVITLRDCKKMFNL